MNFIDLYKKIVDLDQPVSEAIKIQVDSPEEADMIMQVLNKLDGMDGDQPEMGPPDDAEQMASFRDMLIDPESPGEEDCGCGDSDMEETYGNEPDEEYKNVKAITQDVAGGLNAPHKQYKKEYPGDNPMAAETIKRKLASMYESYR